jgi:hypothetical protein
MDPRRGKVVHVILKFARWSGLQLVRRNSDRTQQIQGKAPKVSQRDSFISEVLLLLNTIQVSRIICGLSEAPKRLRQFKIYY